MVRERRRSRLRRSVQEELIRHFCEGLTARSAARIVGVNRNTAILFYHKLREAIVDGLEAETPELVRGEIEIDERYFGDHRKKESGRDVAGRVPVFGLLKRQDKVHVVIVQDTRSDKPTPAMREKIRPDSIVYTDTSRSHGVFDVSGFRHQRINQTTLFADPYGPIDDIEDFWSEAKRHLRSYNGITQQHFHLFIKECEWRFNTRPAAHRHQTLTRWWFR